MIPSDTAAPAAPPLSAKDKAALLKDPYAAANIAATAITHGGRFSVGVDVTVVLGTGCGGVMRHFGEPVCTLDVAELPYFALTTAPDHAGKLHLFSLENRERLAVFEGRRHAYEREPEDSVEVAIVQAMHAIRVAAAIMKGETSTGTIFLVSAVGACNPNWLPGDVATIMGDMNLTGHTPLLWRREFPDRTSVYTPRLWQLCHDIDARPESRVFLRRLKRAILAQIMGHDYATRWEWQLHNLVMQTSTIDLYGNSLNEGLVESMTMCYEAMVAQEAGIRNILGLGVVTDLCSGMNNGPLDHGVIVAESEKAADRVGRLIAAVLEEDV